jgi:murein DD-endopeptidase MepM/ murein hydrolase activator NlpD
VLAAGCSADVARFDFPAFNLNDNGPGPTGAVPPPAQRGMAPASVEQQPLAPVAVPAEDARLTRRANYNSAPVQVAHAGHQQGPEPSYGTPPPEREGAPPPASRRDTGRAPRSIEVQPGDTLSSIARHYRVSISELMTINRLTSPALKPGQMLLLPASSRTRRPLTRTETASAPSPRSAPAPETSSLGQRWSGTYTLRSGESLYAIARQHGVSLAELQQANGIADARKVRAGTVLKVPGAVADARGARQVEPLTPAPARSTQPPSRPTIINGTDSSEAVPRLSALGGEPPGPMRSERAGERRMAALPEPQAAAPAGMNFRWPVKGRVISEFGRRADGSQSDGINVAVPMGTEVVAAESGTVTYAGSELKTYGNLVLVTHEGGWVTAYAHNDQILVQRGDKVRRGQVIAKAGRTGTVDQPQVHFELRQGPKPVDPMAYLDRN